MWVDVVSEARHGTPSVGDLMLRTAGNIVSYRENPGVCSVKKCVPNGERKFQGTPVSLGETFRYVLGWRPVIRLLTMVTILSVITLELDQSVANGVRTICLYLVPNFLCAKIEA